jgi:hypothetical protein
MGPSDERRRWIEIGVLTGAAILLYQLRLAFFLSAVPLFLLGFRRDSYAQLYGAGIFLLAVGLETLLRLNDLVSQPLRGYLFVLEFSYPLSLVTGVLVLQWREGRALRRLLEASIAVGALSVPVILVFRNSPELTAFLTEQIRIISESLREALSQGAQTTPPAGELAGDPMVSMIETWFFRYYLFSYFLVLTAVWAVADGIYRRMSGRKPFSLLAFSVPESFLWPLIGLWAVILLDVLLGVGFLGALAWNAGMILLFVYALQGIGIMGYLFRRYGVGRGLRVVVTVAAVVILFTPGINLVLVVGVPLLGISEYWIHYRMGEGE